MLRFFILSTLIGQALSDCHLLPELNGATSMSSGILGTAFVVTGGVVKWANGTEYNSCNIDSASTVGDVAIGSDISCYFPSDKVRQLEYLPTGATGASTQTTYHGYTYYDWNQIGQICFLKNAVSNSNPPHNCYGIDFTIDATDFIMLTERSGIAISGGLLKYLQSSDVYNNDWSSVSIINKANGEEVYALAVAADASPKLYYSAHSSSTYITSVYQGIFGQSFPDLERVEILHGCDLDLRAASTLSDQLEIVYDTHTVYYLHNALNQVWVANSTNHYADLDTYCHNTGGFRLWDRCVKLSDSLIDYYPEAVDICNNAGGRLLTDLTYIEWYRLTELLRYKHMKDAVSDSLVFATSDPFEKLITNHHGPSTPDCPCARFTIQASTMDISIHSCDCNPTTSLNNGHYALCEYNMTESVTGVAGSTPAPDPSTTTRPNGHNTQSPSVSNSLPTDDGSTTSGISTSSQMTSTESQKTSSVFSDISTTTSQNDDLSTSSTTNGLSTSSPISVFSNVSTTTILFPSTSSQNTSINMTNPLSSTTNNPQPPITSMFRYTTKTKTSIGATATNTSTRAGVDEPVSGATSKDIASTTAHQAHHTTTKVVPSLEDELDENNVNQLITTKHTQYELIDNENMTATVQLWERDINATLTTDAFRCPSYHSVHVVLRCGMPSGTVKCIKHNVTLSESNSTYSNLTDIHNVTHVLDNTNMSLVTNLTTITSAGGISTTQTTTVLPIDYYKTGLDVYEVSNGRELTIAVCGIAGCLIVALMVIADGIVGHLYRNAKKLQVVDPALIDDGKKGGEWLSLYSGKVWPSQTSLLNLSETNEGTPITPSILMQPPLLATVPAKKAVSKPKMDSLKPQTKTKIRKRKPAQPKELVAFETFVTKKYGTVPSVISDMDFLSQIIIDMGRYQKRIRPRKPAKTVVKRTADVRKSQFKDSFDRAWKRTADDAKTARRVSYIRRQFRLQLSDNKKRVFLSS